MKDGGISPVRAQEAAPADQTPLLQAEHVRTLEPHVDFIVAEATDFVRADPDYDGGITGRDEDRPRRRGLRAGLRAATRPARRSATDGRDSQHATTTSWGSSTPGPAAATPPSTPTDYRDDLDAIDGNGHVAVPEGPGLGVTYDWDYIRAHTAERLTLGAVPD